MKWFDRRFSFDIPEWMFPNIVERLRGTPVRARHLVDGITIERLIIRFDDGWSAQENIGHLLDLEPLWLARIEDILSGESLLREADLTNRLTEKANHNSRSIDTILDEFQRERRRIVKRLDSAKNEMIGASAVHPRLLEPMRLVDLAFFVAEHDDHHLARVSSLLGR